jgi:hypothetical protein
MKRRKAQRWVVPGVLDFTDWPDRGYSVAYYHATSLVIEPEVPWPRAENTTAPYVKRRTTGVETRCHPFLLRDWGGWASENTHWGQVSCGDGCFSPVGNQTNRQSPMPKAGLETSTWNKNCSNNRNPPTTTCVRQPDQTLVFSSSGGSGKMECSS